MHNNIILVAEKCAQLKTLKLLSQIKRQESDKYTTTSNVYIPED